MKRLSTLLPLLATAILCIILASCDRRHAQDDFSTSATVQEEETASIAETVTTQPEETETVAATDYSTSAVTAATTKVAPTTKPISTIPTTKPSTTAATTTVAPPTTKPIITNAPTTEPPATTEPPTVVPTERPTNIITDSEDGDIELAVIDMINNHRIAEGPGTLSYSAELSAAADIRAKEIVSNFSHTRPDGSLWYTAGTGIMGENIAKGYSTSDKVVTAWMNSEGHRKNILTKNYTLTGVGCYYDSSTDTYYWVQLFG